MANFFITYDLIKDKDYKTLHEALERRGGVKLLRSVWLIEVNLTAAKIRDWLKTVTDSDDKFAVVELGHDWATKHVSKEANDWLKAHL